MENEEIKLSSGVYNLVTFIILILSVLTLIFTLNIGINEIKESRAKVKKLETECTESVEGQRIKTDWEYDFDGRNTSRKYTSEFSYVVDNKKYKTTVKSGIEPLETETIFYNPKNPEVSYVSGYNYNNYKISYVRIIIETLSVVVILSSGFYFIWGYNSCT